MNLEPAGVSCEIRAMAAKSDSRVPVEVSANIFRARNSPPQIRKQYDVVPSITATTIPAEPPSLPGEVHIYSGDDVTYLDPFLGPLTGNLYLTNYKMYFQSAPIEGEPDKAYILSIPLGMISHMEKKRLSWFSPCWEGKTTYCLEMYCKDLHTLRFALKEEIHVLYDQLQNVAFPMSDSKNVFAYSFEGVYQEDGWKVYDAEKELQRMGVGSEGCSWRITTANQEFAVCETYPRVLGVPSHCSDEEIRAVAQFRSKGRLPILSWLHPVTHAAITRSSQPLVGLSTKKSREDEALIQAIREANSDPSKKLIIMDARPWINAVFNVVTGGGYEYEYVYANTKFNFLDIGNIHVMRKSLHVLQDICQTDVDDKRWLSKLEATHWLDYIQAVLQGAVRVAEVVDKQKCSVLVHCSDGWDRTAQLTSLAMLMLDPYFRTIKGFEILLEKEWISFGHKFSQRVGHGDKNHDNDQRAPIFLQFVDCVWQMTVQFPKAFEFNENFLVTILDHLYSCLFGTFLGNCEKRRAELGVKERTKSLWSYINSQIDDYKNAQYTQHRELFPSVSILKLQLWSGYYLRWNPKLKPQVNESEAL